MEMANKWCIRFSVEGGYTARWITRKDNPIGRDEVQEWADTQVRTNDELLSVDDIYAADDDE